VEFFSCPYYESLCPNYQGIWPTKEIQHKQDGYAYLCKASSYRVPIQFNSIYFENIQTYTILVDVNYLDEQTAILQDTHRNQKVVPPSYNIGNNFIKLLLIKTK
jgi:hypothetical protein